MKTAFLLSSFLLVSMVCGTSTAATGTERSDDSRAFTQKICSVSGEAAEMPEAFSDGEVWDMSKAETDGRFVRTYRFYGDTLFTRTAHGSRDLFAVYNDTVSYLGTNDRHTQTRYLGGGIPYIFPSTVGKTSEVPDSACVHVACETESLIYPGATVTVMRGGTIIFAEGDTVKAPACIRTAVSDSTAVYTQYRLYARECVFPVVEYYETITTDGVKTSHTLICPPSEQERLPEGKAKEYCFADNFRAGDDHFAPGRGDGSGDNYTRIPGGIPTGIYTLEIGSGKVSVTFIADADALSAESGNTPSAMAILADIGGRVYATSDGDMTVDTSILPPGVYLLYIRYGELTDTHKFTIGDR